MTLQITANPKRQSAFGITANTRRTASVGSKVNWDSLFDLPAIIQDLEDLTTTGLLVNTASGGDIATRTIVAPATGITITNGDGVAGNPTLVLANDLAALEAMSGTGLVSRIASETYAQRTLTGTSNEIEISNGDGVSGNPTLGIPNSFWQQAYTWTGKQTLQAGLLIDTGFYSDTFTGAGADMPMMFNQTGEASVEGPVVGGQFTLESTGGSADAGNNYRVALTSSVVGNEDSGNIYAWNGIVQGYAGTGGYKITGAEVDLNQLGANANTLGASTAAIGFEAVAAGNFESTAAFWATKQGSGLWTYGYATSGPAGTGASIKTADFYSGSNSANILQAVGSHTQGIDFSGATISSNVINASANGFSVGPTGAISALSLALSGSTAVAGPSIFPNSNSLVIAMGTSGLSINNNAVSATRLAMTDTGKLTLSPITTFASATAATWDDFNISSQTTTITGNTGSPITRLAKATIYRPTLTDSSAVTVTDAASLYIENSPAAAGSVTITNAWALHVGAGNTKLGGALTLTGNATLGGTVDITGNVTVNTNKFVLTASTGNLTITGVLVNALNISTAELRTGSADLGGAAGYVSYTGISDLTANSTGVGTIKFKGATSRDSSGFIRVRIDTTQYFVPVFSAITG